jgi:putative redox protein
MVEIAITYDGTLRCSATHDPSGTGLITDAPVDNQGKGESFSPTDLLATALGTCMMTYIGLLAERTGWDVTGTTMRVQKEMVADPIRRVGRLVVDIHIPIELSDKDLTVVENTVTTCPVKMSISDRIQVPITVTGRPATWKPA